MYFSFYIGIVHPIHFGFSIYPFIIAPAGEVGGMQGYLYFNEFMIVVLVVVELPGQLPV